MRLAATLAFVCGFASLSLEILWIRLFGFAEFSTPSAFGLVLGLYLVGIAIGAALGARACRRAADERQLWRWALAALLLSSALSPLLPGVFAIAKRAGVDDPFLSFALIATASAVLSFVFPIAHHLGTERTGAARGRHFARVYLANVTGAALGPLVTGYVLLDQLTLQTSFLLLGAFQALAAMALALARDPGVPRRVFVGAALASGTGIVLAGAVLDPHALLQYSGDRVAAKMVIENRHGVVTVFGDPDGDAVRGGNVYDGRTNLDPARNNNGLERPLLAAVLNPHPRRILMAGLSIGTWLAVVREFPGVESIDVVEINPGYLEAIKAYAPQAAALQDARVHLAIDDARRWLRNRPAKQYDVVIMNTTMHWRSNATLLLSREMMQLIRSHMAPGAVLAFNATGSPDAFHTAAQVFPHTYRYQNFVYASDTDFRAEKDSPRALRTYQALRLGGTPFFAMSPDRVAAFLGYPFHDLSADQRRMARPLEVITDDNLLTEFRYGTLPLYGWLNPFRQTP